MSQNNMPAQRLFQLYLLAKMRPGPVIVEALQTLGASEQEMKDAQRNLAARGLEEVAPPIDLFIGLLGPPESRGLVDGLKRGSPFFGSVALCFHLPLWPSFSFIANVHPDGYAWGLRFARRLAESKPPLMSALDLTPWSVVAEEVKQHFGPGQPEDSWGTWEDFSYSIPKQPGGKPRAYLLGFDFALLSRIVVL